MTRTTWRRLLLLVVILNVQCSMFNVFAQISIGGNVYGGGNAGDTGGSTSVTVYGGDLKAVFGGARMANVNGSALVNIDGEHASDHIIITSVYGGNDIAGTIGHSTKLPVDKNNQPILSKTTENKINNDCNVFVRTTATAASKNLVIGSLFGGGNGDYDYTSEAYAGKNKPVIDSTYLEILGGCIAHLYGGGNNATVNKSTTICIDNDSPVLTETVVYPADATTDEGKAQLVKLAQRMGLSTFQSTLDSYAYNFARVFGGNNKAEMAIRPKWNLQKGVIRDLYSGGNQGAMTNSEGLLLEIDPTPDADGKTDKLVIGNVYGGCRMADIRPLDSGTLESGAFVETKSTDIQLSEVDASGSLKYKFPAGLAARVLVRGGDITNVYGGNDITGKVYGGNAVGIYTSIRGDVYGGGNGSYAYTDNPTLGSSPLFKDFYYNPANIPGGSSIDALNAFRPNAEQVSIRLSGK